MARATLLRTIKDTALGIWMHHTQQNAHGSILRWPEPAPTRSVLYKFCHCRIRFFFKRTPFQKARRNMSALANSVEFVQIQTGVSFLSPRVCQGAGSWQALSISSNTLYSNYQTWMVTVDLATDWCSCLSDSVCYIGLSYCFKTSLSSSIRDSLWWHPLSELNTKQPPHWVCRICSNYQHLGDQEARTCKKSGWIAM